MSDLSVWTCCCCRLVCAQNVHAVAMRARRECEFAHAGCAVARARALLHASCARRIDSTCAPRRSDDARRVSDSESDMRNDRCARLRRIRAARGTSRRARAPDMQELNSSHVGCGVGCCARMRYRRRERSRACALGGGLVWFVGLRLCDVVCVPVGAVRQCVDG